MFSNDVHPRQAADGLWGYADYEERFVIPPAYSLEPGSFSEGLAVVPNSDPSSNPTLYGYIDLQGKQVIPFQFTSAGPFKEGLAAVGKGRDTKYGYINSQGKIVIPFEFDDVFEFSSGAGVVESGKRYGLVDHKGRVLVKPRFEYPFRFIEGIAAVKEKGKYGYLFPNGSWLAVPRYDQADDFSNGRGIVSLNGRPGWLDKNGQEHIPPYYEFDWKSAGVHFTNVQLQERESAGLCPKQNSSGKWGYVDPTNHFVIPPIFPSEPGDFSEGLAPVSVGIPNGTQWGFINVAGRFVIPPAFEYQPEPFTEGRAVVMLNNPSNYFKKWRYGYIDHRGKQIIPAKFDSAWSFDKGVAIISEGGGCRRNFVYDSLTWVNGCLAGLGGVIGGKEVHGKDALSKWGMIDKQGDYIVQPSFDHIGPFNEAGVAEVTREGKTGYLTRDGKISWTK